MKPLTHEELNRIEKVGMVTQFMPFSDEKMEWRTIEKKALDALIAAARHSIPRPIAEYPLDGTGGNIDALDRDGVRWTDVYFKDGWWKAETSDRCHRIYDPDFVSYVPVPKQEDV